MSERKECEFIKEHLKKDNRLMVIYPPTELEQGKIHWDIMLFMEDCWNPECSMRVSREYIDGKFKNQWCQLNTWKLFKDEIDVVVYVIKEEF